LSGSAGLDVLGRVEVVTKRDDLAAIVERQGVAEGWVPFAADVASGWE
jgi:hypothetical protein